MSVEEETWVICGVCGSEVDKAETNECTACGREVCPEHYVPNVGMCTDCHKED